MLRYYVLMHLVIFSWGFTGIIGKITTVPAIDLVWWRTAIASICLFVWLAVSKSFQRISLKNKLHFLGLGVLVGIHWVTFFHAIKISNVSLTLTILAACPMFISMVEPLMFRRRVAISEVALGLCSFVVLGYILRGQTEFGFAALVAVFSTFVVSIFCILNARLARTHSAGLMSAYEMLGAFLFCSTYYFLIEININDVSALDIFTISLLDFGWIAILGVVCTAVAFLLSIYLYKFISAFTFSLSNNLETVYGIVLGYLFFGQSEVMASDFYLAALLLLLIAIADPIIKKLLKIKA